MPEPATEPGDTKTEAPGGVPVADNETVPVKPPRAAIVTVVLALPPRAIETDEEFALMLKSETSLTVRLIGVL